MCQESYWDEQAYCQLRFSTEKMIHTGCMCELHANRNDFMKKGCNFQRIEIIFLLAMKSVGYHAFLKELLIVDI